MSRRLRSLVVWHQRPRTNGSQDALGMAYWSRLVDSRARGLELFCAAKVSRMLTGIRDEPGILDGLAIVQLVAPAA